VERPTTQPQPAATQWWRDALGARTPAGAHIVIGLIPAPEAALRLYPVESDALAILLGSQPPNDSSMNSAENSTICVRPIVTGGCSVAVSVPSNDPQPVDLVAGLRPIWSRLEALRNGTLPLETVGAALRLARVRRLITLDGPGPVLRQICDGVAQPWDLRPELTPELLRSRLAAALRAGARHVAVVDIPDPAHRRAIDELSAFVGEKVELVRLPVGASGE